LKQMLVSPAATASNHSLGVRKKLSALAGISRVRQASAARYTSAVAHSGCKPATCSVRNGHQETPQTKALNSRASTGRVEGIN
jgi:hypothetical protein